MKPSTAISAKRMSKSKMPTEAKPSEQQPTKVHRRRHKNFNSFTHYLYRVLQQTHDSEVSITKKAMSVMDSMMIDIFQRLCTESRKLVEYNKKHTIGAKEVQSSVKLLFPGELSKHALSEGSKAVVRYHK